MNREIKHKREEKQIGNLHVILDAEDCGSGYLDTDVSIGNQNLCHISYPEIHDFLTELRAVVDKYGI